MEKKLLYTRSETARLLSVSVDTLDAMRNDCVMECLFLWAPPWRVPVWVQSSGRLAGLSVWELVL